MLAVHRYLNMDYCREMYDIVEEINSIVREGSR